MKTFLPITLFIGLLTCATALAQSAVPSRMSYQAIVTDDAGDPLAPIAPVSYEITMRIWNAATGGVLIWSEKQVTDVFEGRFAIILGDGVDVDAAGGTTEPRPDLGTIFTFDQRFTEITVREAVPAALSKTLAPRQQLVATATAFRAKVAESLGTGTNTALTVADSGNVGIGMNTPGQKLDVAGNIRAYGGNAAIFVGDSNGTNRAILAVAAGAGAFSSSAAANDAILRAETGGKLLLQSGAQGAAIVIDTDNNVGIGLTTTDPEVALDVNGVIRAHNGTSGAPSNGRHGGPGQRLILWPGSAGVTPYGLGIASGALWSAVPTGSLHAWYEGTTERMRINSGGNVGIGTTSPGQKLDVAGNIRAYGGNSSISVGDSNGTHRATLGVAASDGAFSISASANDAILRAETGKLLLQSGAQGAAIAIATNNQVGIGTTTPTKAMLVVEGAGSPWTDIPNLTQFTTGASALTGIGPATVPVSIYASSSIWTGNRIMASSDERMKMIEGRSDGEADLDTLVGIEITDYRYRDTIAKGDAPQKKVIAQQVERVFPQAVSKQNDVVPDIYQPAEMQENGWVSLQTDLKKGELVRLIGGKSEGTHEVLEVAEGKFRTDFMPEGDKVFVYGREVDDFRTVDYDALAMLNISATQELHRRLEAKEKEVEALKSRLNVMDEKMVAILELLSADQGTIIKPVSLTSETVSN